jgi:hypothetical protein
MDGSRDTALTITLPAGLRAGVNPVQVVHRVPIGDPPVGHTGVGFESNTAALVLAPVVTTPTPVSVARGTALTLAVAPPAGRDQRVSVLVGDVAIAVPARPPSAPEVSAGVAVQVPADLATGTFLLRVQVDGAVSALAVDTTPGSPTFNRYVGPLIEVT